MKKKSLIGITMGCPAGVGPEIIINSYPKIKFKNTIILGDLSVLNYYKKKFKSNIEFNIINSLDNSTKLSDTEINVLDFNNCDIKNLKIGEPSKLSGKSSLDYITAGVNLCLQNKLSAIVTCPINKESINKAGCGFPGHTELLGYLTDTKNFGMMLEGKYLKVLLVTKHIAVKDISKKLTVNKIFDIIKLAHTSLIDDFGIEQPRIAVTSLNPHAGEHGLFGNEEQTKIIPAIKKAEESGINIKGPFAADTLFPKVKNNFDCVVCMYHDQGLIPLKFLAFGCGVNITVGLPIVRTSVDHGTAYDIVEQNLANPGSLIHAYKRAKNIVKNRLF